jgi:hypothetical protein
MAMVCKEEYYMSAKSTAKKKKWFIRKCEDGCQICGIKIPGPSNYGLEFSHIINKNAGGGDTEINCLALCPNCAYSFDYILKPAIYNALEELNNKKVPENWKDGEGRIKP